MLARTYHDASPFQGYEQLHELGLYEWKFKSQVGFQRPNELVRAATRKKQLPQPPPMGLEGGHLARRRLTLGPAMADSRVQNDALGQSTTPQDKERGGPVCVGEADVAKRRVGATRGPQGVTPRPSR